MDNNNGKVLMDIRESLGSLKERVDHVINNYEEGRVAAREHAKETKDYLKYIKEELRHKLDKREHKGLVALSWVFINWKVIILVLGILSLSGFVSVKWDVIRVFQ